MRLGTGVPCVVVALLTLLGARGDGSSLSQPQPLDMRAAQILELFDAAPRRVAFRIEVDAIPACNASAPAYAFLIDADRMRQTGGMTRAFPELGIDAQVEIRCDPASKQFASASGAVAVTQGAGTNPARLEVVTALDVLPSRAFNWIAVARQGSRYVRMPAAGRYEGWRTVDRWLH